MYNKYYYKLYIHALTLHLSSTQLIKSLLEDLPRMFGNNKIGHCALGAALLVAEKLLVS